MSELTPVLRRPNRLRRGVLAVAAIAAGEALTAACDHGSSVDPIPFPPSPSASPSKAPASSPSTAPAPLSPAEALKADTYAEMLGLAARIIKQATLSNFNGSFRWQRVTDIRPADEDLVSYSRTVYQTQPDGHGHFIEYIAGVTSAGPTQGVYDPAAITEVSMAVTPTHMSYPAVEDEARAVEDWHRLSDTSGNIIYEISTGSPDGKHSITYSTDATLKPTDKVLPLTPERLQELAYKGNGFLDPLPG